MNRTMNCTESACYCLHYKIGLIFFVDLMFLETSALTGENVEETFLKCARNILTKIESGESGGHFQENLMFSFDGVSRSSHD